MNKYAVEIELRGWVFPPIVVVAPTEEDAIETVKRTYGEDVVINHIAPDNIVILFSGGKV